MSVELTLCMSQEKEKELECSRVKQTKHIRFLSNFGQYT